jgi:hypothetical protein
VEKKEKSVRPTTLAAASSSTGYALSGARMNSSSGAHVLFHRTWWSSLRSASDALSWCLDKKPTTAGLASSALAYTPKTDCVSSKKGNQRSAWHHCTWNKQDHFHS